MKTPVAMIQQVISRDTLMKVRSFKDFHDHTKREMAHRMGESIEHKMEYSCEEDIQIDSLVVRGKVVIMSPKEYQDLMLERKQLKEELRQYKTYRHGVQDTGGTIPNRPMTEEENRRHWGIFG